MGKFSGEIADEVRDVVVKEIVRDRLGTFGKVFYVTESAERLNDLKAKFDDVFTTVDGAVSAATANRGDVILVDREYTETLDSAGDITLDIAGVTVICLGSGDNVPTFTFDGADATPSIVVSAKNVTWIGGKFVNDEASLAHMFDVKADDFHIKNAFFTEGSATGLFFIVADTADGDSDRLKVENCRFYAPTAGNMDAAIQLGKDHVGVRLLDNDIYGDFDHGGIEVPAGGNACLDLVIRGGRIVNLLSGAEAIDINGTTCTGEIADVRLGTDAIATAINNGSLRTYNVSWASTDDQVGASPVLLGGNYIPGLGFRVTKSHNVATDNVDLFTVTGRVAITALVGEVTTVIGGAATYLIRVKTANTNLFAATTIDSAAVDTLIVPTGDAGDAASVVVKNADFNGKGGAPLFVVGSLGDASTLESDMDAADTGVIRWDLYYLPLDVGASVVAA